MLQTLQNDSSWYGVSLENDQIFTYLDDTDDVEFVIETVDNINLALQDFQKHAALRG